MKKTNSLKSTFLASVRLGMLVFLLYLIPSVTQMLSAQANPLPPMKSKQAALTIIQDELVALNARLAAYGTRQPADQTFNSLAATEEAYRQVLIYLEDVNIDVQRALHAAYPAFIKNIFPGLPSGGGSFIGFNSHNWPVSYTALVDKLKL